MGIFDRFRRRRPTSAEAARLSRITNPQQRAALLMAIERGEPIPEYAWHPIPRDLDAVALYREFLERVKRAPTGLPGEPGEDRRRARPAGGTAADPGLAVIDHLFSVMRIDAEWSIREPRGFTWWGHRLAQRVWAEPLHRSDGFDLARVHAETDLLRDVPDTRRTGRALALANHHASMSAFLWAPSEGRVRLHCAANVHRETLDTVKALLTTAVALQAADAHIKADAMAGLLGGAPDVSAHPEGGPRPDPDDMLYVIERLYAPEGRGPAPITPEALAAAARMSPRPWREVRVEGLELRGLLLGAGYPSGTALFRATAGERHPQLGSGLFLLLTIPYGDEPEDNQDRLVALAHEWNAEESRASTGPYFLGAWCLGQPPAPGLSFVTFIPTARYADGLIEAMVIQAAARAVLTRRSLEEATRDLRAWAGSIRSDTPNVAPDSPLKRAIGRTLEWDAAEAWESLADDLSEEGPSEERPAQE